MTASRLTAEGTRFAVYVCPPADSALYRLGSEVLGYDVRARQVRPLPADVRPEWQALAGPYGFHLTLVEGFWCAAASLPAIEAEVRAAAACLSPAADVSLHAGRMEYRSGTGIGLMFGPSPHLLVLHTLLLARLAPFVTDSPFEVRLRRDPALYPAGWQRQRLALLRTPRGLDTFEPHYTLVDPCLGSAQEREALGQRLSRDFAAFLTTPMPVESVSLFVKPDGEERWQVRADIPLPAVRRELQRT